MFILLAAVDHFHYAHDRSDGTQIKHELFAISGPSVVLEMYGSSTFKEEAKVKMTCILLFGQQGETKKGLKKNKEKKHEVHNFHNYP